MSWIDRIQTDLSITTGDGRVYTPMYLNASKNVVYNVARFEFKETAGTLVKRGTPRGTEYAIEIYFQGENHLDDAAAFEVSAADPRAWTIAHPLYGSLTVQPIGLTFENTAANHTRISGGIVETIIETPDKPSTSAADKILADKDAADAAFSEGVAVSVPQLITADLQQMIRNTAGAYKAVLGKISVPADAQAFLNLYNTANSAITDATKNTFYVLDKLRAFYSAPLGFADDVAGRITMLGNMLGYLNTTVSSDMSRTARLIYEHNGAMLISSAIGAAVSNAVYGSRRITLRTITTLTGHYNTFLTNLDSLQTLTGGLPGSFIPSAGPLQLLGSLVSYGVTALLRIAASSRQDRTMYTAEDTNIILLAQQLYGLKEDDSTIDALISENDIGMDELLIIRKGRLITYYV